MSYESLLIHTCTIARKTTDTDNDYGHTPVTWSNVATGVRCRIQQMFVTSSFHSQTPNGQIRGNDYLAFFSKNANLQIGDRIYWNEASLYLYVRPFDLVGDSNATHHIEVSLGLQET